MESRHWRQIVWFVRYGLTRCRVAQSGLNNRVKTRVRKISEATIFTIQIEITLLSNLELCGYSADIRFDIRECVNLWLCDFLYTRHVYNGSSAGDRPLLVLPPTLTHLRCLLFTEPI
jgi:hypothetical protein